MSELKTFNNYIKEDISNNMYFIKIIQDANDAFWAVVSKSFPDIKSGDFSPEATM